MRYRSSLAEFSPGSNASGYTSALLADWITSIILWRQNMELYILTSRAPTFY
ncbi:hypothetical protein Hanom_Chr03g00259181 [Helianthus anomalus]